MKNNTYLYLILILSLNSNFILHSQEKVFINVRYSFIHIKDTTNIEVPFEEKVILSVAQKSSRYCSERRYNEANNIKESKPSTNAQNAGSTKVVSGGPLLMVNDTGTLMREEIIKNFDENELVLTASLGLKSFKVSTDIPEIKWKILTDIKNIGEIPCQKAIGKYAGRTYIAWFAPSLPFNDGPWKLSGFLG